MTPILVTPDTQNEVMERALNHGRLWTYAHYGCRCDKCREAKRLDTAKCAERNRERVKEWRKANPERHREQGRRYVDRHRDEKNARDREYQRKRWTENRDEMLAKQRAYSKTEKGRMLNRAKAHRRRGAPLSREAIEWWESLFAPKCFYCGNSATEIDHLTPITRGGSGELSNLVPACRPCNASKNAKTLDEFLAERNAMNKLKVGA